MASKRGFAAREKARKTARKSGKSMYGSGKSNGGGGKSKPKPKGGMGARMKAKRMAAKKKK